MLRTFVLLAVLLAGLTTSPARAGRFEVEKEDSGVTVKLDGKLLTRYLIDNGPKPILWPVIGPTGQEMTRGYPMQPAGPYERDDHVHHRSFWFTHGNVNGVDFWSENENHGSIVHREFVKVSGGDQAVIVTRNDWVGPDGKTVCEDQRTLTFGAEGDTRWIDFDATVTAPGHRVTFGDTKEGSFGVRVAGSMKVTSDMGGTIVNSEGLTNTEAWGKRSAWVDYYGPVGGETVGIAILNHPSSFRYPTYWHVRTYGLFTANPFGLHDFGAGKDGSHTIEPDESFSLRYRVLLHKGDAKQAKVAEAFEKYAKEPASE